MEDDHPRQQAVPRAALRTCPIGDRRVGNPGLMQLGQRDTTMLLRGERVEGGDIHPG